VIWLLVLVQLIGLPLLLALLYPVAIKYERGPKDRWRYLLYVSAGVLSFLGLAAPWRVDIQHALGAPGLAE